MKTTTKKLLMTVLKMTLTVILVAVIGTMIVVLKSPGEGVAEAEADIISGWFGPKSNQHKFVTSLMDQGFEKPRSYDWEGNKFFFTTKETRETPVEVLASMQESFVEAGINKKAHLREPKELSVEDPSQMSEREIQAAEVRLAELDDFFGGGIVPLVVNRDYVSMAGTKSKEEADDGFGFVLESLRSGGPDKTAGVMRHIEAFREPGQALTRVTAVWSDEDLDMDKFNKKGQRADIAADPAIPACIGCTREMRFAGEGDESAYTKTVFAGQNTVQDTVNFYHRALANRGWTPQESHRMMERLKDEGIMPDEHAQLVAYGRGDEVLTVLVVPDYDTGGSKVHVMQSP